MCHSSCIIFGAVNLTQEKVKNKKILEIGSSNVNGSLRPIIEMYKPLEYTGVDIEKGPGVDQVCYAENLVQTFGKSSYDIVIATELFEHIRDWKTAISNIKNVIKPGGLLLATTRSRGFLYHAFPYDFWRFEIDDFKSIFSDFIIEKLETDAIAPGVFLLAKKPDNFKETDLSSYALYSIVTDSRVNNIDDRTLKSFQKRIVRNQHIRNLVNALFALGKKVIK